MRPIGGVASETWGSLVRFNRTRLGMTQDELAEALGVVRKTISRWENQNAKPETYETAEAAIIKLGMDRAAGLRAAGYAPKVPGRIAEDPYAYVREMGLDPNNRVVRRILNLAGVSEEFRMKALRRERELQLRDEQRRLDDFEWTIQQQREEDQREAS